MLANRKVILFDISSLLEYYSFIGKTIEESRIELIKIIGKAWRSSRTIKFYCFFDRTYDNDKVTIHLFKELKFNCLFFDDVYKEIIPYIKSNTVIVSNDKSFLQLVYFKISSVKRVVFDNFALNYCKHHLLKNELEEKILEKRLEIVTQYNRRLGTKDVPTRKKYRALMAAYLLSDRDRSKGIKGGRLRPGHVFYREPVLTEPWVYEAIAKLEWKLEEGELSLDNWLPNFSSVEKVFKKYDLQFSFKRFRNDYRVAVFYIDRSYFMLQTNPNINQ